jgi:proteasome assembly chaperone (PAC2) family protein
MADALEIWEKPQDDEDVYMLVGWRQWADAGAVSSGLPQYLIQRTNAHHIGVIHPDGFYLFQVPGTYDLVRPTVKFKDGFPETLQSQRNDFFYAQAGGKNLVIFIGDEPHMDVERYIGAVLDAAQQLNVKRIIGFGGVYGELPYEKQRMVSCTYSQPGMKEEVGQLEVNLSDYQGGASIGSYLCRRAADQELEYVSFYAFVPAYDFSMVSQIGNTIRIENDYMAWLGVMRRVNHMLKMQFSLADLEQKSERLIKLVESKVEEIDSIDPQIGVRDYLKKLSDDFTEVTFSPVDDLWEDELRRLLDKFDGDEEEK